MSANPGSIPLLAKPKKRQVNFHNYKRVIQSIHYSAGVVKLLYEPKRNVLFVGLSTGMVLFYLVSFPEDAAASGPGFSQFVNPNSPPGVPTLTHIHTYKPNSKDELLSMMWDAPNDLLWMASAKAINVFSMREGCGVFSAKLPESCSPATAVAFAPDLRIAFVGDSDGFLSALFVNLVDIQLRAIKKISSQTAMPPLPPPVRAANGAMVAQPAPPLPPIKHLMYMPKLRLLIAQLGNQTVEWFAQVGPSVHPELPLPLTDLMPSNPVTLGGVKQRFNIACAAYCRIRHQLFLGGSGGVVTKFDHAKAFKTENAWRLDPIKDAVITCLHWSLENCWLFAGSSSGEVTILSFRSVVGCYDVGTISEVLKNDRREIAIAEGSRAKAQVKDLAHNSEHVFGWSVQGQEQALPVVESPKTAVILMAQQSARNLNANA